MSNTIIFMLLTCFQVVFRYISKKALQIFVFVTCSHKIIRSSNNSNYQRTPVKQEIWYVKVKGTLSTSVCIVRAECRANAASSYVPWRPGSSTPNSIDEKQKKSELVVVSQHNETQLSRPSMYVDLFLTNCLFVES